MGVTPFFSIILPVYNVEKDLARCLDVLLAEAFSDYEMILVDDGSPDGCPQICDSYAEKYGKIRVLHKENGGLSSARNAGFDLAMGKYIFWLDSDDYLVAGALRTMAEALQKTPADILKFNHIRMPAGERIVSSLEPGFYETSEIRAKILPLLLDDSGNFVLSAWSHIYRREFLTDQGLRFVSEREIGSEDYLFNFQAFQKAERLLVIGDCLYHYVYRPGSITGRYRKNLIEQYRRLYLAMKGSLQENHTEEYAKRLDKFYVKSAYYILISNECGFTREHGKKEALQNIRQLLRQKEIRNALRTVSLEGEPLSSRIILLLFKYQCACGLWLLKTVRRKRQARIDRRNGR